MVTNPPPFGAAAPSSTTSLLLVVAPFEENAKRVESHLRNAGHKVRTVWISQVPELEQQLQKSQPDLLLAADHVREIPFKAVLDACRRFAPNLPVLALSAQLSGDATASALAVGARDSVSDVDPESLQHLERVVVRELIAYRNLRELARSHSLLADYESRYSQLIAGTGDAVAHFCEGIISKVNPAFATLIGHADAEDLAGVPLMDLVVPEQQSAVRDHLKQLQQGRADGKPLECALMSRAGDKVPVRAQLTRGEADGESFVEMLIRAEATQATNVTTESGRLEFCKALDAPPTDNVPRAALFAVIDSFSALEERVGYIDAEQVAIQTGAKLAAMLGSDHQLYRFSTQEFGALFSRADGLQFESLAQQIAQEVATQVFSTADHESQVTLSLMVYPLGGADTASQVVSDLVREARKLSSRGGNRAVLLGPTARANAEEREDQRKADAIRKAIEENRFKLAYQTIASLEGDTRQHFDVLVRMINEEGVELHASDFFRTAEKAGLARSIDRWVISRGMKIQAGRERRKDKEASMLFLKLSEDSLRDADNFIAWVHDMLKGRKFGEDEICIEIQEMVLQNHIRKAKVLTKTLRDNGASVAIEHFGIGANSAQLIEHLPINFLKFHSSYTQNFGEKDIQKKMSDLMDMAKQRRIKTIVSHVEDANVMARMWQMGVNYIQGYHIQEPEVVMLT
ncbi:MAG: response regulator [Panacagrimonas sp.]|nr:EAL domain-containing protein [Panacagrimonas sp.]MCC2657220.1 response regulator [Panacagrimonas sp.]